MADTLNAGDTLNVNDSIASNNGQYILTLPGDGNLVLYLADPAGWEALWASHTWHRNVNNAVMQGDGNFVLYGGNGAVWATGTYHYPGAHLVLQDDGNAVIYEPGGRPVWATNTWHGGLRGKLVGWA